MFAWPMCYNHTISKQNENNFSWVCICVGGVDESYIKISHCSIVNCYHWWENGIWRGLLILVLCRVRMNYSKSRMYEQPCQSLQQVSQVRSTSFTSAVVLAHERAEVHIQAGRLHFRIVFYHQICCEGFADLIVLVVESLKANFLHDFFYNDM